MTDLTPWHTWREIHAQPQIWRDFATELEAEANDLRRWIATDADAVWLSGAGTSAYIGDFVAAALAADSERPLLSVPSTDLVSAPSQFPIGRGRPLLLSFGRSGNSAESVGALNVMDALAPDAPRLNITCNKESALATRPASNQRVVVLPDACHDQGFAMTSSYTTMLLTALTLLDPARPGDALPRLADALEDALPAFQSLSESITTPDRVVVTGSGALRFAAREAALKIMELSAGQIPALWDSSLGFRHGPKSFVTPNTHVFCMVSSDPAIARYDRDLAAELRQQFPGLSVTELAPPPINDTWGGVIPVVAAQIFAVHLASRLGLNVDDPFKGQGTLTRVVGDVKLYPPAGQA